MRYMALLVFMSNKKESKFANCFWFAEKFSKIIWPSDCLVCATSVGISEVIGAIMVRLITGRIKTNR